MRERPLATSGWILPPAIVTAAVDALESRPKAAHAP
jgi:hypothetical protein